MKRLLRLLTGSVAGIVLVLAALIFFPRRYDVPKWEALPGTRYLHLADRTKLGYQVLNADRERSPYPVVFLQGGPGGYISAAVLSMLKPFAAAGFGVWVYDPAGSGGSSRMASVREYTADRHMQDLDAVIALTGAERVVLIGQSWGGILASLYTAAHPERVAGIVLTCPGPLPGNNTPEPAAAPDSLELRPPQYSNRQANAQMASLRTRAAAWLAQDFGIKLMPDAEADAFQSTLNRLLATSTYCDTSSAPAAVTPGSGYYAQVMTLRSLRRVRDPRPALRALQIPVLILKGQCDNLPWSVTQEYARIFSGSRLVVIPGAGHNIAAEQPERYHAEILQFLRSVTANN